MPLFLSLIISFDLSVGGEGYKMGCSSTMFEASLFGIDVFHCGNVGLVARLCLAGTIGVIIQSIRTIRMT